MTELEERPFNGDLPIQKESELWCFRGTLARSEPLHGETEKN